MTTITKTTHPGRRRSHRLGTRIAVATLLALAVAWQGGSPASARSVTPPPVINPAGFAPPGDPCWLAPQILSFTATPSTITLGETTPLSWKVQVPSGCSYTVQVGGETPTQSIGALQGTVTVQPFYTGTYQLDVSSGGGPAGPLTTWVSRWTC